MKKLFLMACILMLANSHCADRYNQYPVHLDDIPTVCARHAYVLRCSDSKALPLPGCQAVALHILHRNALSDLSITAKPLQVYSFQVKPGSYQFGVATYCGPEKDSEKKIALGLIRSYKETITALREGWEQVEDQPIEGWLIYTRPQKIHDEVVFLNAASDWLSCLDGVGAFKLFENTFLCIKHSHRSKFHDKFGFALSHDGRLKESQ
jgi:hypothetical protein